MSYDPTVGRFLSEDPIGFDSGDANVYRYVDNRSTTHVDPDGLKSEWHHLLIQAPDFASYWSAAGLDLHSAEFGWIIDTEYHRRNPGGKAAPGGKLHPRWEECWRDFKTKNPVADKEKILAQLERMRLQFSHLLRNGKQATLSYTEWNEWQKYLREAAERAAKTKGSVTVKLPAKSVLSKAGRVVKILPAITFVYVASTDSVAVAAEGCTEDALWPFLDIGRAASEPFAGIVQEATRGGILNRRRQTAWIQRVLDDPKNAELSKPGSGQAK